MSPTDEAAMNRWTGHHDAEAFRTLAQRYAGAVFATCKRILGNVAAAKDVTQECFEHLAKTKTTTQIRALGPWLHGVATKRCLSHIRSEGRRREREATYAEEQDAETEIEWSDIYDCIEEAIDALPDDLREPIVGHFLYGDTHAAIARATGTPRRTITSRIEQGVESVGTALKARGITVPSGILASLFASNLAQAVTLPGSLTAALGKVALTHSSSVTAAATRTAPLTPMLSWKAMAVITVTILGGVGLKLFLSSPEPTEFLQDPSEELTIETPPDVAPPPDEIVAISADDPVSPAVAVLDDEPDLITGPRGAVEGMVTFFGRPAPNQSMSGHAYTGAEAAFLTSTDAQGRYRVEGLEPGELTVGALFRISEEYVRTPKEREWLMAHASHDDGPPRVWAGSNRRVTVEADKTIRVDFAWPTPPRVPPPNSGSLEGYILVDGQIPETANINLISADNRWVNAQGPDAISPEGYYRLDSVAEGDYFVRLHLAEPRPMGIEWWTRVAIIANEVTTLDINVDRTHAGTIQGPSMACATESSSGRSRFEGRSKSLLHTRQHGSLKWMRASANTLEQRIESARIEWSIWLPARTPWWGQ